MLTLIIAVLYNEHCTRPDTHFQVTKQELFKQETWLSLSCFNSPIWNNFDSKPWIMVTFFFKVSIRILIFLFHNYVPLKQKQTVSNKHYSSHSFYSMSTMSLQQNVSPALTSSSNPLSSQYWRSTRAL